MKQLITFLVLLLSSPIYAADNVANDSTNLVKVSVNFNSPDAIIVYTVPAGKTFVLKDVYGASGGTLAIDNNTNAGSYSNPIARISLGNFTPTGTIDENYSFATGLTFKSETHVVLWDSGLTSFADGSLYGHVTLSGYLY